MTEALYLGSDRKYELVLGDGRSAVVRSPAANSETFAPGDAVKLAWKVDDGVLVGESSPA